MKILILNEDDVNHRRTVRHHVSLIFVGTKLIFFFLNVPLGGTRAEWNVSLKTTVVKVENV